MVLAYWTESPQYNGVRSVVKNGWEFKFGQRGLVEGNVIDNVWCCYSQYGWDFLLTPKNNNGTGPGNANSVIQDITIRYNLFRRTGRVPDRARHSVSRQRIPDARVETHLYP